MTDVLTQKRYMLTNLKFVRAWDDWDETDEWSLYLIDADYTLIDAHLNARFGKYPNFRIKACIAGPRQMSLRSTFSSKSMKEGPRGFHSYLINEKGNRDLVRDVFKFVSR